MNLEMISNTMFKLALLDPDNWCPTPPIIKPPKKRFDLEILQSSTPSILGRFAEVAITPKPIPPREEFSALLAGVILESYAKINEIKAFAPQSFNDEIDSNFTQFMSDFIPSCGFKNKGQLIDEILRKLGLTWPPVPPFPDPDPQPDPDWYKEFFSPSDLLIIGSIISAGTNNGAIKEMGLGLMKDGISRVE
jgi:hypothetical protein